MKKPRILSAGIAVILALPSIVSAADRTWVGLGTPGLWTDPLNWDSGVPVAGDNIFVRPTGNVSAPAFDGGNVFVATGTPDVLTSGFTFGSGTTNIGFLAVGEAHNGPNPTTNRFGRAFINAGTTLNVGQFFVGDWDGGTGQVLQGGGDVNVSGQFRVGHWPQADVGAGTASSYTLNAGTVTVSGDPTNPFDEGQGGNVFLGIDSTGVLTINGGTFTSKGITLDNRGATAGKDTLAINGGTVNVGANGIVSEKNALDTSTYEVRLSGGVLRATAGFTSNLEMNVVGGGTGIKIDTNGNTVALTNNLVGEGGITKVSAGSLQLSGRNSFAGGLTINGGTVELSNGSTVGTGATLIASGAKLSSNSTTVVVLANAVSGTGAVAVDAGILRLGNVSGSLATTVASGATLGVAGTLGAVSASSGSTLEVGVGGIGNFTASTLTLGAGAGDTQTLKFTVGTTTPQLVVTGNNGLVANGSTTIQINAAGLTAGTYTLIDYAGTIGGAGFGSFNLVGLPARATGGLINSGTDTAIKLSITAIDFPKWTGAIDANWNGTTQNWKLVNAGGSTNYQNQDAVLFDDTAIGSTTINLAAAFTPAAVSFNNSTKTYTLGGSGEIAGATGLLKQGTGRVILSTVNSYTGPTDIRAGTLQVGDGISGSINAVSPVTVGAAGTLELNLSGAYASPTSGTGTVRTIGANSFEVAASVFAGTPKLVIAGDSSQVIGVNNQPAYDGDITISSGTFKALGVQSLGSLTGTTTITNGGTLDVNNVDLGAEQVFVAGTGVGDNGAIVNYGGGTILNLHKVTLTADATFGGSGRWDIRTSGTPGEFLDLAGHKLTKVGGNQVSAVEVLITPGDIDINGGIFSIEGQTTAQGAGTITLNAGGTLGLYVNGADKVTRQIVANGGGILELGSGQSGTINSPISMRADLPYAVNGGNTVVNQVGNITESGGSFILNKNGDGRLVLLGNNSWTGGFNVNAGTLQVGTNGVDGTLGTGPATILGTLTVSKSNTTTINGDINPNGPEGQIQITGGGAVTLTDGTDVNVRVLSFGLNGVNDTVGGTLNVVPGSSLVVNDTIAIGNSAGSGSLTQGVINQTGGTVEINAPNTDGRNFVLGHWGNTQGIYNLSAGTLTSPNISMSVSWDGEGSFNQTGGTANVRGLRFGHNGGRTGVYNLTGGTLALGVDGIWAENAGTPNDINLGGGIVKAATDAPISLPVELTGTNGDVTFDTNGNTLTLTGAISGSGGLTKAGAGRLVIDAANSAAGIFVVNAGTLSVRGEQTQNRIAANGIVQVNSGGAFEFGSTNPAAFSVNYIVNAGGTITNAAGVNHAHLGSVNLNGGTWTTDAASGEYNGENYFLHTGVSVTGTVPSLITQEGGTAANRGIGWSGNVTFDVADVTASSAADLTVSTELEDSDMAAAALIKSGQGTMDVAFANSYTGGTTINAGTLRVNNLTGSGTGTGNVSVAAGARLGGSGIVGAGGAVSVSISGKLAPGNSGLVSAGKLTFDLGTGALDVEGAVTAPASASLEFNLGSVNDSVLLTTGTLHIGTGVLNFDDFLFTRDAGFTGGDIVLFDSNNPIDGTLGTALSGSLGGGAFGTIQFGDNNHDLVLHVIPEPGSALLLAAGAGILGAFRRRRRAQTI
ncbi:MAG: outer rane autotransporter barrel domain protein [Chthoniobacteraceae bacterium]|nr:outer rane autotransporter barrel domain protein [Chthoniobacteraceae bacterium]